MSKSDKKEEEKPVSQEQEQKTPDKETAEDKLKSTEEKLLRTLAEMENQRRRFEKERDEAFEFGGFNFARESLAIIDKTNPGKPAPAPISTCLLYTSPSPRDS